MPRYTIFVPHPSNFLTDHRPYGDGLLAWGFLERLADRGHRLHVACQRVDVASAPRDDLRLYPLTGAPKLHARRRIRYMGRVRRLYAAIAARERIDLVHQLNPVDAGLSLALPRSAAPVVLGPYVPDWPDGSSRHDAAPHAPGARERAGSALRRAARRRQQQRAALVLLSSEGARTKVAPDVPDDRVAIVPPGIEARRFAGPAANGARRPPTVLFLANVQVRKGVFTLVDAFEQVAAALPEARLVVAGGGADADALRRRVAASSAGDRVELLGTVGRDAIAATLGAADVYCLPSFGEPFGISALEAMAAGLPLVTTSAGGLAHLVPPSGGLQVPPRDPDALAAALLALLRDPARRAAMGAANRATVASDFEWDRVIDRLEALYARVLAARG